MGSIWIREFIGGLDARRLPETSAAGVLIAARDGHITRGGEFEKRAAFVTAYELPAGTVGMARTRTSLIVFGSDPEPVGLPVGITYQRLQHPAGTADLVEVPSFDLYSGKVYAVGVFTDGSTHHFYDGVRVEDWFDGRARATFRVVGGGEQPAVAATGSFAITGGTLGGGNEIASVTVGGVTVTSGAVAHTGDNATTAAAVAANIVAHTSVPNYTATSDGAVVTIEAVTPGADANERVVAATVGGDATVGSEEDMAGGSDAGTSELLSVRVDGVSALLASVPWQDSNTATAAAVAAGINASLTAPEYTAISYDDTVVILAESPGSASNGKVVQFTTALGFTISPATDLIMEGGADADDAFQPGRFVKTLGSKMYSNSGPNMHFSGIQQPTQWTTDAVGAGFIDMSSYASGSEVLTALAKYQNYIAVFAESNIQIWYTDPDPTNNRWTQDLNNTGTASAHSVTQFGDNDLFYLGESGIRSLRARDSSNAASTNDIGVSVDPLVSEKLRELSAGERERVFGLIEPRDGRFWMVMKNRIFVLSFFSGGSGAGVNAWTFYEPGFDVEQALVFNRRVYLRSGDTIYVYGGTGADPVFDDTEAYLQTPYMDADDPTRVKTLTGVDAAVLGNWKVEVGMDFNDLDARDRIATITKSTFRNHRIPANGDSTHFSLIFKSTGSAYGRVGSAVLHYTGGADEDK